MAAQPAALPPTVIHTVMPAPQSIRPGSGVFPVTAQTAILIRGTDERVVAVGRYLSRLLFRAEGPVTPAVETGVDAPRDGSIHLSLGPTSEPVGDEGYVLSVTAQRVTLSAAHPAGLFYGVQTLRHLMPATVEYESALKQTLHAATAEVVDAPRFPWRGSMLDVARHFFGVDDVKRYIDLLAMLKINRLHLHLADDQGWRIEIPSWPNLTTHGGSTQVGGGPGGFYTRAQFADIITYAQSRFITIVPEIDMPGHTNAALASYAELNCDGKAPPLYTQTEVGFSALCHDKEITYKFIDDVVRDIAAVSPGPYFHIGGDEVKKLTPPQYVAFIERVQAIVAKHGKQMIVWDEVEPVALQPATILHHWRPRKDPRPAVTPGVRFILSPWNKSYLDMKYDAQTTLGLDWGGLIEVRDSYDWDPATNVPGVPDSAIIGVESPLWSETIADMEDIEFMMFPRIAAAAEIGWTPQPQRQWTEFATRLGAQAPRWTALGINFYRSPQINWIHAK